MSLLFTAGCSSTTEYEDVASGPRVYELVVPANLAATLPSPIRNPGTQEGVELGEKLFYDPVLSQTGTVSCATCHQPQKAFTDGKALTTLGVTGKPLRRHVPSLVNLAWMNGYFWDGGAKDLESMVFGPLTDPDEMGQSLKELTNTLQRHEQYPELFRKAFGTDSVTSAAVARALAQYLRTLISADSRYDKHVRGETGGYMNKEELQGWALFKQHCSSCHATDFFTDNGYHNNGLDSTFSANYEELAFGRGRITGQLSDRGKYKTPTLRNIALTAPYMHDGRFETLDDVLEHYRSGVRMSPALAIELQQEGRLGIALSGAEKANIIAFLTTLTDTGFIKTKSLIAPL
ncbi:cytochrome-c peroxidase [Pontibacter silvestris]|uniref:Cytochrome-c peroxidase n=1 Tax=Pontibacter silvestris TaxID=2305183 RepID=A0ABW4X1C6_9BACT